MKTHRTFLWSGAVALCLGLPACGPDGVDVGDKCPDVPLYKYVFDEDTDQWVRVSVIDDGGNRGIENLVVGHAGGHRSESGAPRQKVRADTCI